MNVESVIEKLWGLARENEMQISEKK